MTFVVTSRTRGSRALGKLTPGMVGLAFLGGVIAGIVGQAKADNVATTLFTDYNDSSPNGVSFFGTPFATLQTPDLAQFGTVTNFNWHPNGISSFAADAVGHINVTTADSFTFVLTGAQSSYLFVDGALVTTHSSLLVDHDQTTIPLAAGLHAVEVQFDVVNPPGSDSGFEVSISPGGFAFVPEPASVGLLAAGVCGLLMSRRRNH
ncbi:MAG TPA: PEP-CTERM sorting domain-containing protein [Tepidisphaeraceae bacterium]|jgi:hypothetical protein